MTAAHAKWHTAILESRTRNSESPRRHKDNYNQALHLDPARSVRVDGTRPCWPIARPTSPTAAEFFHAPYRRIPATSTICCWLRLCNSTVAKPRQAQPTRKLRACHRTGRRRKTKRTGFSQTSRSCIFDGLRRLILVTSSTGLNAQIQLHIIFPGRSRRRQIERAFDHARYRNSSDLKRPIWSASGASARNEPCILFT